MGNTATEPDGLAVTKTQLMPPCGARRVDWATAQVPQTSPKIRAKGAMSKLSSELKASRPDLHVHVDGARLDAFKGDGSDLCEHPPPHAACRGSVAEGDGAIGTFGELKILCTQLSAPLDQFRKRGILGLNLDTPTAIDFSNQRE